jgi:DNA sulfur modification protein DndB
MGKGEDFNKRVWTLFGRAGFQTKPNDQDLEEHRVFLSAEDKDGRPLDLYAHDPDLGVTLIASNKARKKLKSFTAHIHDLAKLKEIAKADAALFISEEKKMLEKERNIAAKNGIQIWDEHELAYFEAVANAVGPYAKYEISHSLGLVTKQETFRQTVLALRFEQPNVTSPTKTEILVFVLPADKLLRMAVVLRRARGRALAYQRIIAKSRLPGIASFLKAPDALLPTSLVVHLSHKVRVTELRQEFKDKAGDVITAGSLDPKLVALDLPMEFASLEVIDGQHRLFAFSHTEESTKKAFDLAVVGIRNLTEERRSDTFVAINDKAKRVDANLRAMLRYTDNEKICKQDPELMAIKIAIELNKKAPFEDAVRTFDLGKQVLTLKGVSGYDLKGLIAQNGLLRKHYPSNSSEVYVKVLRQYFHIIANTFPAEWSAPKKYIVATNRGVTAFLKLLRSILRTTEKKLAVPTMRKYLKALRSNWPTSWETGALKKSYVGHQGWSQLHQDMVEAIRKKYPKFDKD